jgi:hypothetical protein
LKLNKLDRYKTLRTSNRSQLNVRNKHLIYYYVLTSCLEELIDNIQINSILTEDMQTEFNEKLKELDVWLNDPS